VSRPARGPGKPGRTDGLPPTSESRPAVRPGANHAGPSLLLAASHASRRWAWTSESRPAVRPRANHARRSPLLAAPHASRRWAWTSASRAAVRPRANHAGPSLLLAAPHASRRWAWTSTSRPDLRPRANHARPSPLPAASHASRRWAWTSTSRPAVRPRANHARPSLLLAASHASRRSGNSVTPPNGVRYFAPLRPGGWSDSPHPLVRSGANRSTPARLPNSGRPPAVSPKTIISSVNSRFYGACHGSPKEVFGFGTAIADVFFRADD
jgi:hypothetical protein